MPVYDFDFERYVERRKGAREAERREGSAYAYAGDLRIRRMLGRARPVTLALESTVKLWQATARAELLGTSVRITERSYPRVWRAAELAAARLHVTLPPLHASPAAGIAASTFGTDDEPVVLLHASLCDALADGELVHALGTELGRIQNGGALLGTARHFLHRAPGGFLRWVVGPARAALDLWWRRGLVTADRAGLLASRDLVAAAGAMRKVAAATPEAGDDGDPAGAGAARDEGQVVARLAALEAFAGSAYYRGLLGEPGGTSPDDTDRSVARIFKGKP